MPTHKDLLDIVKRYKKKKCPSHSTSVPRDSRGKPKPRYHSKNRLQKIINDFVMVPVAFPPPSGSKTKSPPKQKKKSRKPKSAIPKIDPINNFNNEPISRRLRPRKK